MYYPTPSYILGTCSGCSVYNELLQLGTGVYGVYTNDNMVFLAVSIYSVTLSEQGVARIEH